MNTNKTYLIIGIIILIIILFSFFFSTSKKVSNTTSFGMVQGTLPNITAGKEKKVVLSDNDGNLSSVPSYDGLVPSGFIGMWNGTDIPQGWVFCDGKLYDKSTGNEATKDTVSENKIITPDLRGRFIRMFSNDLSGDSSWNSYITKPIGPDVPNKEYNGQSRTEQISYIQKLKLGDFGGTDVQKLTIEEMPSHDHPITGMMWGAGPGYRGGDNEIGGSASMGKSGGSQSHNNTPPYYVLAYIMKL